MQPLASFSFRARISRAARSYSHARIFIVLSMVLIMTALTLFTVRGFSFSANAQSASVATVNAERSYSATQTPLERSDQALSSDAPSIPSKVDTAMRAHVDEAYGKLPLSFEANQGQFDEQVKFQSRGKGYSLSLVADEAVLILQRAAQPRVADHEKNNGLNLPDPPSAEQTLSTSILHMKLVGSNNAAQVDGQEELPGKVNYLTGDNPQKWRTDVPTYASVKFKGIYPKIDLVYYGNQRQLEYDFLVAPGGDPRAVKLRFENSEQIKIDGEGDLIVAVEGGNVRLQRPFIYQIDSAGEKQEVTGRYALSSHHEVGFKIAAYDHERPLVIDPVLSYSTFLGGGGNDQANGIAVDAAGNAYITGSTSSSNFPTAGTQLSFSDFSSGSAFISKINAEGTALIYSTYLGGDSYDIANAIALDSQGNAYLAGQTSSINFPLVNPLKQKTNLYQTTNSGANWTPKPTGISSSIRSLAFDPTMPSTLYAGTYNGLYQSTDSGNTWARTGNAGIPANRTFLNVYVDPTQPSTIYAGTQTAGMLKSTNRGDTWTQVNLGNNNTSGRVMAFAPSNPSTIYITCTNKICKSVDGGNTWSSAGAGLFANESQVIAVDPTNSSIVYSGTFGGGVYKTTDGGNTWNAINSGLEATFGNYITSLAIDPLTPSTIYVGSGYANNSGAIFKSVNGGGNWTAINNGVPSNYQINALLIDANSSSTLYAATAGGGILKTTNAGGNWTPVNSGLWYTFVYALVANPSAPSTLFSGTTNSANESSNNSDDDAFLCKLNSSGNALVYSTYLGGSGHEYGYGIAVDPAGNAYITGQTDSNNFPTLNAAQINKGSNDGASDAFLMKVNSDGSALLYSTYLGGSVGDTGYAVAADTSGNAYVTGQTSSLNFPIVNAFQSSVSVYSSSAAAFVTKLSDAGALVYSTYLGGSSGGTDSGRAIAVDAEGCAYVTGQAGSTNFPTLNPIQGANGGGSSDAFVTKLSAGGNSLVYSTYLGGNNTDIGRGVSVDAQGNAYVTGATSSPNFPTRNSLQSRSGIFKSSDGAGSWSNNNVEGLPDNGIQALLLDPIQPSTMYAIVAMNGSSIGIFKSVNSGRNWSSINNGLPALPINALAIDPVTPATLYAGTGNGYVGGNGIYKSTDGGNHWTSVNNNLPAQYRSILSLAVNPSTPSSVFAGTYSGIVKSMDGGGTWNAVTSNAISTVTSLTFDPLTPTTIYAASNTSNGGVFKSVDGGVNWSAANTGLTTTYISRVVVDPLTPSTVYAGTSGSLFKSTDGGNHWNALSLASFNGTLALDPQTPATLYAATTSGLYKSTNGGGSWFPANNGMFYKNVSALVVHPSLPSIIYAGTYSVFIYDSDVFVTKLNSTGTALIYSTYLGVTVPPSGGNNTGDAGTAIALDVSNNAYVTGVAGAPDFPTTPGSFRTTNSGYGDAFISKLSMAYNISGQILDASGAPLSGVRVVLSGARSQTITTDSDGTFMFVNLPQGATYTLVPLKPHYDFNPASFTVNSLGSDQVANFAASATSTTYYNISGHIVDENNNNLMGVAVALSGSQNDTMTTDASGNYSFTVPATGNYSVTPSYSTFTFNPSSQTFSSLNNNQVADFNGTRGNFVVTNTHDGGAGSFRQAILNANAIPGRDAINFQIGSGAQTINLNSALPTITDPVIIDASTQPGYSGAPLIELNGNGLGTPTNSVSGLVITAGNTVVRGFVINRFSDIGIVFSTNGGNTLQGTYVGLDLTGTIRRSNQSGVLFNCSNNLIGGNTPASRNVISGNSFAGLSIVGSNNTVQGNFIGTNAGGTIAIGNSHGVNISNGSDAPSINNLIGGTTKGAGNLISGNSNYGIYTYGNSTTIQGNLIGTDATGTLKLGNSSAININGSSSAIGGTIPGARNIISGNGGGITVGSTASSCRIEGNFIGTDITGTALLGNSGAGVDVSASNIVIGGTTPEARNVISGNISVGVYLNGGSGVVAVQGNYIGTDVSGTHSLGNDYGVIISTPNNTIGGLTSGARNLISGNNTGVQVGGFNLANIPGNKILGNFIGTDASGDHALPNTLDGIVIASALNTTVGGTEYNAVNLIASNGRSGVIVSSGTGNNVRGNSIHSNGGLGLDLYSPNSIGVTPNDAGDGDTGANNLQNFPVITSVVTNNGVTNIQGTLNSTANAGFTLDFYANNACEASGYGEGRNYIGSTTVTTTGNDASFSIAFPTFTISAGQFLTATATDAAGNTSEFSRCAQVSGPINYSISGQVSNNQSTGIGGVTVSLSGSLSMTTTTDSNGNYSFSNLPAGGNYLITPSGQNLLFNPSSRTFNNLSSNATSDFLAPDPMSVNPGNVLISEFRFRGVAGANDEFIELYNNTDFSITVNDTSSSGWALVTANGSTLVTIPNGTIIPAHAHYLVANNTNPGGYSLSSVAAPDLTYTADIADDTGMALFRSANPSNFTIANRLDAVGFDLVTNPLYKEANGIQHIGSVDGEYTFVRKVSNTTLLPQDTDDNAADFNFVSTTSGSFNTIPSILGAPGPENLLSPIARNNTIAASLIDPTAPRLAAPNFVRVGSGNSGTISIRRQFTNQTGAPVTRLRFRIIDITTLGSTVITPPQAQLRLADSGDETVSTNFGTVTVKGTGLEYPTQSYSGGLNTSMNVALPNEGLAVGASINVQFLMNVAQNGRFRFYISTEALP
jgi:photosystem II stability/assembly factor-like uncharacterized protein